MKILLSILVLFTLSGCASTDQKVNAGNLILTAVTVKQKGCLPIGSNLDPNVACVNTDSDAKLQACFLAGVIVVAGPIPIPICQAGTVPPITVTPTTLSTTVEAIPPKCAIVCSDNNHCQRVCTN